jgi:hypothetical protein
VRRKTKIARWGIAAVAAVLTLATAAACTSSPSSTPATAFDPPRLTEYEENHLVAEDAA